MYFLNVLKRKEVEVCDLSMPYMVSVPLPERCEVVLGGERMEEVKEFKYLGTMLPRHGKT